MNFEKKKIVEIEAYDWKTSLENYNSSTFNWKMQKFQFLLANVSSRTFEITVFYSSSTDRSLLLNKKKKKLSE